MKILAIICEFNPFHNGHKYLLERAKKLSNCDALLCIMSENFTQRGDICLADKYARAKHAILGGADCVIQLPAPFAVAPAEIFAAGAVKILNAIPDVTTLAFGCENDVKSDFLSAAELLIDESPNFKNELAENLARGESYVKSYAAAFTACGGNKETVQNPNNILALEYVKAIKRLNAHIDILPIKRVGGGYNDGELKENFSSASAIRRNLDDPAVKDNMPKWVFEDLKRTDICAEYENFLRNCLFKARAENLTRIYGCNEGLENKLKALQNSPFTEIVANATSRRYSSSRIKRILCANALELHSDETRQFLDEDLYIKPLAIKKSRADEILPVLAKSAYPIITGAECDMLDNTAKACFEKDKFEHRLYEHITRTSHKDYMTLI